MVGFSKRYFVKPARSAPGHAVSRASGLMLAAVETLRRRGQVEVECIRESLGIEDSGCVFRGFPFFVCVVVVR